MFLPQKKINSTSVLAQKDKYLSVFTETIKSLNILNQSIVTEGKRIEDEVYKLNAEKEAILKVKEENEKILENINKIFEK